MAQSQAMDGRQSFAWILDVAAADTEASSSTNLEAGKIVIVTGMADSESGFGSNKNLINKPVLVSKQLTLKQGDKYRLCTPIFLGMAKDKSLNKTKNTQDVTVDADGATNNVCDGLVSISGSISCSFSVDGEGYASNYIKKRFGNIIKIDNTGKPTLTEAITTEKDLVLFAWNARNASASDIVEFDVVPCLFTGINHSASYGSSQSFDIDFTGNATDENGYEAATVQIEEGLSFIRLLTTNRAGMDQDAQASV